MLLYSSTVWERVKVDIPKASCLWDGDLEDRQIPPQITSQQLQRWVTKSH